VAEGPRRQQTPAHYPCKAPLTLVEKRGWTPTVRWAFRVVMPKRAASSRTSLSSCGSIMPPLPHDAPCTSKHRWIVAELPQEAAETLLPAEATVAGSAAAAATSSWAAAPAARQQRRPMASTAAGAHQALRRTLAAQGTFMDIYQCARCNPLGVVRTRILQCTYNADGLLADAHTRPVDKGGATNHVVSACRRCCDAIGLRAAGLKQSGSTSGSPDGARRISPLARRTTASR
jgi:hypothetical protein